LSETSNMSKPPDTPQPDQVRPSNSAGVGGLILSGLGLLGWITLFVLIQPYEEPERGNIGPAVVNVFAFGFNAVLVLVGSSVSGTLSFAGLLMGTIGLTRAQDRSSQLAAILGVVGLLAGAALLIWRYAVVFG
jgi:hypothetical protein